MKKYPLPILVLLVASVLFVIGFCSAKGDPRDLPVWPAKYHHHHHHSPTPTPSPTPLWTPSATPTPTPTATPTPSPTPTPTPSPSPTPSPTATPTPTPTPIAVLKDPSQLIMTLDSALAWTNPASDGVRERYGWNDFQTKLSDQINWATLDADIALAVKNNKHLGISVVMCAYEKPKPQTWPSDLDPTATYDITASLSGKVRTIILAWDPKVLPEILKFTVALCQHVDGKVDYVAMGGLGSVMESIWADSPSDIGMSEADALAAWTSTCTAITEAYAANLKSTTFIFTADFPFSGAASKTALDTLIRGLAAKYPHRFGVMNCGLSEKSNTGYIPFKLVSDLSSTNPTGLQFVASTQGLPGHPGVDLAGSLTAAETLKAHWIEPYPLDSNDPANLATFRAAAAKLAK